MKRNVNNIHNYNKFLQKLDEINKNRENKNWLNNKYASMPILIKQINNQITENNYHSCHFSGYLSNDNIFNKENPNLYKEVNSLQKEFVSIDIKINSIDDLLKIIEKYPVDNTKEYNINVNLLNNIKEPLIELKNIIGMYSLKKNILDQILYYLQDLHLNGTDFLHTVIYGPPGTGKTEIAKIISKLFAKMGILNSGVFKKVTRSDLISGYLGQTALKTKDVIKECLGGVLFIDEAYALGNYEKKDSFSKECIDTLCEALSDYKDNLMVIIAGYENELKECFFSYNSGLESRFTWRFKTDYYSAEDLKNILIQLLNENNSDIT